MINSSVVTVILNIVEYYRQKPFRPEINMLDFVQFKFLRKKETQLAHAKFEK